MNTQFALPLPQGENDLSIPATVMKFGGTSLEDAAAFSRVARLLVSSEAPTVVVVSAMSGVTDALMKALDVACAHQGPAAEVLLDEQLERHLEVAVDLCPQALPKVQVVIEGVRRQITDVLRLAGNEPGAFGATSDAVSAYGEMLSAQLLTFVLNELGSPALYVDSRRCITTDNAHGNARPLAAPTTANTRMILGPLLEQKRLPVLGGFIGATEHGVTTTMGRGSSDYTATLVSAALGARKTQIWTDVNGVQTADPVLVNTARTIPCLTYDEAEEMARLGAKVLHRRMFEPVRSKRIPIRICNSRAPEAAGTLINDQRDVLKPVQTIRAITYKNHQARIDITSTPAFVANGFQRSIENVFEDRRLPVEIVGRAPTGMSFVCDEVPQLSAIIADLKRIGSVEVTGGRVVVGCVGEGLRVTNRQHETLTNILRSFEPGARWEKTNAVNMVCVVRSDIASSLVRTLHRELFE